VGISSALTVIFPVLDVFKHRTHVWEYALLICSYLLLFLVPLFLTAEFVRPRIRFSGGSSGKHINVRAMLFCAASLIFAALFLYVTSEGGLFFRRIGFSALVERSIAMPIYDLVIHRSFMEVATTLFCTIIALATAAPLLRSVRLTLAGTLLLAFGSYFSFVLLNNRFQSAILLLELLIALLYFVGADSKDKRSVLVGAVVLISVVSLYSFRVTNNIRDQIYIFGCIDATVANPFQSYLDIFVRAQNLDGRCDGVRVSVGENMLEMSEHLAGSGRLDKQKTGAAYSAEKQAYDSISAETKEMLKGAIERPWIQRLNALKLLAEITKPAFDQGFGWGRFWTKSTALYVYYFTDKEQYFQIKRDLKTNPKVLIAEAYLREKIDDTPSTILTDLYANFSFLGFLVGGVFMGVALAFIDACLRRSLTIGPVVLAFFLLEKSLYAEKEFLTLLIDLVKFAPVPLAAAFLLWKVPIRRITPTQIPATTGFTIPRDRKGR
jgi:hypothetical protein